MQGSTPRKLELPPERLAPEEAKQLSLASALSNFNGMATVTFSYDGHPGDLLVATGSVDQTGTYVFEVMPKAQDDAVGTPMSDRLRDLQAAHALTQIGDAAVQALKEVLLRSETIKCNNGQISGRNLRC